MTDLRNNKLPLLDMPARVARASRPRRDRLRYLQRRWQLRGGSTVFECSESDARLFKELITNHLRLISDVLTRSSQYKATGEVKLAVRRFLDMLQEVASRAKEGSSATLDRAILGSCIQLFEQFVNCFHVRVLNSGAQCTIEIDDGKPPLQFNDSIFLISSDWRRVPPFKRITRTLYQYELPISLLVPRQELSVEVSDSVVRSRVYNNREVAEILKFEGLLVFRKEPLPAEEEEEASSLSISEDSLVLVLEIHWPGPRKTFDFDTKFRELEERLGKHSRESVLTSTPKRPRPAWRGETPLGPVPLTAARALGFATPSGRLFGSPIRSLVLDARQQAVMSEEEKKQLEQSNIRAQAITEAVTRGLSSREGETSQMASSSVGDSALGESALEGAQTATTQGDSSGTDDELD